MSRSRSPVDEVHDDSDGYEFQIALDQLSAGSTDALKIYLARKSGLDPDIVSLQETPWEGPLTSAAGKLSYVGRLDNTRAPDEKDGSMVYRAREIPHVFFEDTETPFRYAPLDPDLRQFRLLRLAPPDEHGVTRQFQLETFCLDEAPPYFCLSYVWGDPHRYLGVNCNGKMISVTQNLFHALRTCLNRHPKTWLWADGICVNQEDVIERSQQVLVMGNIYQKAAMVLAHPGHYSYGRTEPEDRPSVEKTILEDRLGSLGMQDILSFGAEGPAEANLHISPEKPYGLSEFTLKPVDDAYDAENIQGAISIMTYLTRIWNDQRRENVLSDLQWKKTSLPDPETTNGRKAWSNLVQFWTTDWYFRTWVLQEVILGAKVVVLYGTTAISLEAITEFWDLARQRGLPRPLRIGVYADIFNTVLHLSPVGSFKVLRDRREALDKKSEVDEGHKHNIKRSDIDDNDNTDESMGCVGRNDEINSRTLRDVTSPTSNLFELLCLTRNNLATDPRDKIYGLLGLADDTVAQSIVPDYGPDNTVAKLFTQVAAQMVEFGHTTDLLHQAGIDHKIPGLPSWVPDWTMQSRSALPVHLYNCMPGTSPKVSVLNPEESLKLQVRGAVLAQINMPGPAWRYYSHDASLLPFHSFENAPEVDIPPFNDEDARNFILAFVSNVGEEGLGERYSAEGFHDALVRTLAVDCSWHGERIGKRGVLKIAETIPDSGAPLAPMSARGEFFTGVDAFRHFYAGGPESEEDLKIPGVRLHQTNIFKWLLDFDEEVEAGLQKRMVSFTVPFQEAQRGRRWAAMGTREPKTEEALAQEALQKRENHSGKIYGTRSVIDYFMGTVPWNAEVEDYIVLLEGFKTPFVLRKLQVETLPGMKTVFEIVGDCYIHDAMDGQLMIWLDEVDENLEARHIGTSDEGRRYAVRTAESHAIFEDFIIA